MRHVSFKCLLPRYKTEFWTEQDEWWLMSDVYRQSCGSYYPSPTILWKISLSVGASNDIFAAQFILRDEIIADGTQQSAKTVWHQLLFMSSCVISLAINFLSFTLSFSVLHLHLSLVVKIAGFQPCWGQTIVRHFLLRVTLLHEHSSLTLNYKKGT